MTDTPTIPASITAAVPNLDQGKQLRLAREVVMDIRPLATVLKEYELTEEQYDALLTVPFYKNAITIAQREWNSALTTPERLRIQAAAILEQTLPVIGAKATNTDEDLNKIVEAAKILGKIGQVDGSQQQQTSSEKFSIVINIGDDKIELVKDVTPTERDGSEAEIRPLSARAGETMALPAPEPLLPASATAVQPEPEGQGAAETLPTQKTE